MTPIDTIMAGIWLLLVFGITAALSDKAVRWLKRRRVHAAVTRFIRHR